MGQIFRLFVNWRNISSVYSQNLVTLIFTKTTFCQRGNAKRMAHMLSNFRSSRTTLKSINHASKIVSMKISMILVLILPRYEFFFHEKDAQNIVTGCFFTKNGQNDVTQVKLFIMTMKSLL